MMDSFSKEELKAKQKAKELRKAKRESKKIAKNHLPAGSDLIAAFGETIDKNRPIPEQIKALERQKFRLQSKIDRLLKTPDGIRKNEFGPMKVKLIDQALKYATNVPYAGKANKVITDSKESALSPNDKAKIAKHQKAMTRVDFLIWTLEQRLPAKQGGDGNGQFNRNSVPRPRHIEANKARQVQGKAKTANNWRKEFDTRAIAKILYFDDLNPDNQNAFTLALKAFDRLDEQGKAQVVNWQAYYAEKKAKESLS